MTGFHYLIQLYFLYSYSTRLESGKIRIEYQFLVWSPLQFLNGFNVIIQTCIVMQSAIQNYPI